jgi:AraC-like DNA-binding protein/ligand-binding sensor protein
MQITALRNSEVAPNNDKKLLEALAQSKVYRRYERTFMEATGLPLALRPVEFFGLPFQGKKNENGFCAFLAGKGSCSLCLQTQGRCASNPGEQPRSLQCAFGLTETRVPVRLGGRVIGLLATGQIFTRPRKAKLFENSIRRFFAHGSAAEKKAAQLWKQSPSMAPLRYEATVQLLSFFANQLSSLGNQIVTEQTNDEPVMVSRARQFIAQNKQESLTLTAVAHAAGASIFHFCKVFRKATGLKFTDYVSRVRLEDAKALLLNPNLRISEVAYDVGFQSLTQFNRTFRRIFGQSPTEFRAKPPVTRVALAA